MRFYERPIQEYLPLLTAVNEEIWSFFNRFRKRTAPRLFEPHYDLNKKLESQLASVVDYSTLGSVELDQVLITLTREFVPIESLGLQALIYAKMDALQKSTDPQLLAHTNERPVKLRLVLQDVATSIARYQWTEVAAIIVVAVPVEFRAVYRKLEVVTRAQNDYLYQALDVAYDRNKNRTGFYVEGVIVRDNRYVKVAIEFLEEYGSLQAQRATRDSLERHAYALDVITMGVAGHMDASDDTRIGDLVLGCAYYNAYTQKLEARINYGDQTPRMLANDYEKVLGYSPSGWVPKQMVEKRPPTSNPKTQRDASRVLIGRYVSGPPVVKDSEFKKDILKTFPETKAVEMEATGCHMAALDFRIPFKVIKSVCDWSDKSKSKEWQPFCADLAAEFTVDYLIAKHGKPLP